MRQPRFPSQLQLPMNQRSALFATPLPRPLAEAAGFLLLAAFLTIADSRTVLARSWSYHYHPRAVSSSPAPGPSPVVQPQFSTAQLLKQAIVSDLAVYVGQSNYPGSADTSQIAYIVGRLSLFDRMDTPDALEVLASLSGYYLGAPAERLYDCLSLRKGKALEPHLEQFLRSGNPECLRQFGAAFEKSSPALDGHAFCPNDQELTEHLTKLISEIDAAKPCSDSDLAALSGAPMTGAP